MPPAECGVGVDDDILCFAAFSDYIFKYASPKGMQSFEWYIEYPARCDIGGFGVHHVADVEKLDIFIFFTGESAYLFEVVFFIEADSSSDYNNHLVFLQVFEPFLFIVTLQSGDKFAHVARDYFIEVVKRQVDSVVCQTILGEIVRPDFFASIA